MTLELKYRKLDSWVGLWIGYIVLILNVSRPSAILYWILALTGSL